MSPIRNFKPQLESAKKSTEPQHLKIKKPVYPITSVPNNSIVKSPIKNLQIDDFQLKLKKSKSPTKKSSFAIPFIEKEVKVQKPKEKKKRTKVKKSLTKPVNTPQNEIPHIEFDLVDHDQQLMDDWLKVNDRPQSEYINHILRIKS